MPANQHLKHARLVRGWSQQHVAEAIGSTHVNVSRWERGITSPSPYFHQRLCVLFDMNAIALGFVEELAETTASMGSPTEAGGIYDPTIPLPFTASALVGRDQFITHLRQLLSNDSASIALNGLPGVGKTALAITLVSDPSLRAQFPGGILWAALGPQPNVSEILSRWGTLFGIAAAGMGTLKNNEIWARTLHDIIGARRMLIVIDDTWNIEAANALKVGGPHCAYLVTTRFPHIAASFAMKGAIKVSELSEEDGIALLQHLAPEVATYDADIVRTLVRSVGALPLALTLVGKHLYVQMYTGQPRRIHLAIERLRQAEHRLQLSEPPLPTGIYTHLPAGISVSLQAVIAMSEEHIDEQARQTLRALSLFPAKPNTFSEEAALAVSGVPGEGLDVLSDAGLLEINGTGRYTLHQSIADYARLQQNGENVSRRYAEYYKTYIEEHQKEIEALELESQNLFSALAMAYTLGDHTTFARMVFALTDFLLYRGLYEQAALHLNQIYKVTQNTPSIITCLHFLGMVAQKQGEYEHAITYYQEGLTHARKANWQEQVCALLSDLGWVSTKHGHYEQAYTYAQEGLTIARQIDDSEHLCQLLAVSGVIMDEKGDYLQAEKYYQEGLTLARQIHNQEQECIHLIDLGANADYRGNSSEVLRFTQEALACARQLGHLEWQCVTLSNLSGYYEQIEEYEQAKAYNREAIQLARQLGHREWLCQSLLNQAGLAIRANDSAQAEAIAQEALALAIQIEKTIYICNAYRLLGHIALMRHQLDTATDFFSEMMRSVPSGLQALKAESLYRLALVSSAKGEHQEAKELGDAAYAIMVEVGFKHTEEVRQWIAKGYPPSLPIAPH